MYVYALGASKMDERMIGEAGRKVFCLACVFLQAVCVAKIVDIRVLFLMKQPLLL